MEGEPEPYCVLRSVPALHVLNRPASNLSARSVESDPSTRRASPPGGGRGQRRPSAEPNPTPTRPAERPATRDEETVAPRRGVLRGAGRLAPGTGPRRPHVAADQDGPDGHMEAHLGGPGADRGAASGGPADRWGPHPGALPHRGSPTRPPGSPHPPGGGLPRYAPCTVQTAAASRPGGSPVLWPRRPCPWPSDGGSRRPSARVSAGGGGEHEKEKMELMEVVSQIKPARGL